jgi:hypothetical protein
MTVCVSVAPVGIAGLLNLGWLDARRIHSSTALADAIVDLADAALAARLRLR